MPFGRWTKCWAQCVWTDAVGRLDAAVDRDLMINIGINSALMVAGLLVIGQCSHASLSSR